MLLTFDEQRVPNLEQEGLEALFREVPVHLTIGGVELLGWEVGEGLPLSLPKMARGGLRSIREAVTHGRAAYDLGEYGEVLLFKHHNSDVLIHSTMRDRTARVPYYRLEMAWTLFADHVRALLLTQLQQGKRAPQWESWPMWEAWIQGREEPILAKSPRFASWFAAREHLFDRVDASET